MIIRHSSTATAPKAWMTCNRSAGVCGQPPSGPDNVVLSPGTTSSEAASAGKLKLKTIVRAGSLAALGGLAGGLPLLGAFSAFFGTGISQDRASRLCGLAALATNWASPCPWPRGCSPRAPF